MKSKNKLFSILLFVFSFVFLPSVVYAKNHSFDMTAYYCDKQVYNSSDDVTNYENCLQDYVDGNLGSYQKADGDQIDNGSIMLFIINYRVGSVKEVNGFNFTYYYDDSKWTPGLDGTELYVDESIYDITKNLLKRDDNGRASWTFSSSVDLDTNSLNFVLVDNNTTVSLDKDYVVGYFFMKVKSGVNGRLAIEPTDDYMEVSLTSVDEEIEDNFDYTQDLKGISFTTGTEVSTDATLGTLTATNNGTDYFKPEFVSGSETLNYTIYVPYSVTSIDLQATTHDSEATIGDDVTGTGLGVKELSVGAQTYNITVYSKAGNHLTYAVTVYRLNHDATIKNATFTNSVGFTSTNANLQNTFEYNTTVPYATTKTVANALPNDSNASIKSGLGTWNITNVGLNTYTINVEAEDCAYPTIQNNAYADCGKQTYTFKINREEASTNTYLSTITKAYTENGVKETASQLPGYNKTKLEYDLGQVSYETTKVTLNATVEASGKAKIKSSDLGEKTLNVGENTFEINVTAEDGTTTAKYTIKIYRKSNNNYLKTLTVTSTPAGHGSLNTALVKTTLTGYRFNYDELATGYTVYAEVEDTDKAYVSIYNTSGTVGSASQINNNTYTYDITNNQVLITVTAEDGKINTYTVDVGRTTSADSTLKALDITSGDGDTLTEYTLTPEFPDSSTRNYALTVESDVSEVSINAIPNSAFASIKEIKGNYENLSFDNVNKIEIVVEAEDHSTSSYTVDITRKKYDIKTLKELSVTLNGETYDITPELTKGTYDYSLVEQIPYSIDGNKVTSITVNATPTDDVYATVSGTGSRDIHTGSQVLEITVKAHDNTTQKYNLTVVQKKNTDNSIKNFTIRGIAPTLKEEIADVTSYEMEVDNSITEIKPSDVVFIIPDGATKTVNQTLELKTKQDNIYTFTVTSESGIVHEYDVNIKRTSNASNNISLVTLTIGTDSSRTCVMNSNNTCVIEVPVDTLAFKLSATIADTASISPENGTEYELPASTSSKDVPLTVTAENGEIKEYTVQILRAKSSNNDLSSLTINDKTISELTDGAVSFNKKTNTYNVTLEGTINKAKINAEVEDTDKAKLDIVNATDGFNTDNLEYTTNTKEVEFDLTQEKVNVIRVYVEAENGQTKYYTLNITRALRTNALLSDLTYNGVTITGFEKTKYEYTLPDVIYNIPTVTIGATTDDEAATKGGDGVLSIHTGDNTITVTVTAQDKKTTQDYVIHVNRAKNIDTGIKGMTLAGVQAKKNTTTGDYEVTVPNNITIANHDNLVVTVNNPKVETDAKATVSFTDQALFTEDNHPNIIEVTVTAEDNIHQTTYNLVVTRTKSSIATLTSIDITNEDDNVIGSFGTKPFVADTFTPDEDGGIVMTYNVTVPVDTTKFKIKVVPTEPHETIVGDGLYELDTTANDSVTTKTITVTSEDTKVVYNYVLNITRNKSSDNLLKSITVLSDDGETTYPLNEAFKSSDTSYTVNVAGDVENIILTAEKNDNRATIEDESDVLKRHSLNVGDNKFNIKVISESGSPNTYQVNIIRALKPYNNLGKLIINDDTILDKENDINKFSEENKYTLTEVSYKTTKVGYTFETEDADATTEIKVKNEAGITTTVTGDEILLSTGINEITFTVTAQNNMKKTYTVFITRIKNNDATLKTITVKNTKGTQSEVITVVEGTDTYYVTVDEKKEVLYSLEVLYAKSDAKAEVTLDGDLPLVTSNAGVYANEFNIHVVAEDGVAYHDYKLMVRRPKSSDTRIKEVELVGATNESQFKDNVYTYTLDIPYNSDTFTIVGTTYLPTTKVLGNYTYTYYLDDDKQPHLSYVDNGEIKVIDGNKVTLTAVAENGDTQDYVFTVKSAKTDDTVITSLQVIDQPFTTPFAQNIPSYKLKNNLDVSIDALRIVATTRNASATYACILDGVTYDCQDNNLSIPAVAGTKTITVVITSASGTKTKEYYIEYTKVYSSDADLSSLRMTEPEFDLGFNSTTTSYSVNVNNEVTSAKFEFDTNDSNATVYIDDEEQVPVNGVYKYTLENLQEGTNTLTIKTKAQDNSTTNSYTVTVNRAEPEASDDAFLESLAVEGYDFTEEFEIDKYNYSIGEIPYKVNSLNVIASPNYSKSRISYNLDGRNGQDNGTLSIPVEDGQHTIYVNVIAEDGTTTKSYTITYTKEASKNNYLRNIALDNATIEFDKDTNTYSVEVDTDITNMIATITVDDPRSTVQIGSTTYTAPNDSAIVYNMPTLSPGDNKLQIIVIPESSVPANIYEVNVKRQKDELITSEEFGHTIEDGCIKTGILGETGLDMKNELDNKNEHLKIMNADETREISDSEQIATGYIVILTVDNIEQDRKTIVVKGDVNGDGIITLNDAVLTINHYVGVRNSDTTKRRLVGEYLFAADSNVSGDITLNDAVLIINHYVGVRNNDATKKRLVYMR